MLNNNFDELKEILKESVDYDSFYFNALANGFNDENIIEIFYQKNSDLEGIAV